MSRRFSATHRSSASTNESQRVRAMEARHRSNAMGSQYQQQGRVRINKPTSLPSFEKKQQGSLLNAFRYAGQGFMSALAERNFRIHLAVGVAVALVNLFLDVPAVGWALTILCVAGVLVLELLNTALETLVD
ncbi:MAG: diacylglycerol kinase family protein [Eggerthellaceae bacterium]|nr:diacylglycerol kinase family protein [Eggerthellaceae bacterium]